MIKSVYSFISLFYDCFHIDKTKQTAVVYAARSNYCLHCFTTWTQVFVSCGPQLYYVVTVSGFNPRYTTVTTNETVVISIISWNYT